MNNSDINVLFLKSKRSKYTNEVKKFIISKKFNLHTAECISDVAIFADVRLIDILIVDNFDINIDYDSFKDIETRIDFIIFLSDQQRDFSNQNKQYLAYSVTYDDFLNLESKFHKTTYPQIYRNVNIKFDFKYISGYLTQYLIRIGIAPKLVGFKYIKQCIEDAFANNGVLGPLSTAVYPRVSRLNRTSVYNIERNIRTCINSAIKNDKTNKLKNIFKTNKISNKNFLSFVLDQAIITSKQFRDSVNF